ncbi:MAG: serpin family protein [Gemmataceae bacterium]|nr:serpin family protein [Gemmataceae bacterium]
MKSVLILSALAVGTAGTPSAVGRGQPVGEDPVVAGNTHFAADLYAQLAKREGNLFFSPYSISTALAMTYGGARGNTAAQMVQALHLAQPDERLRAGFARLHRLFNDKKIERSYELRTANALWGQTGYGFLPDFLRLTEATYGAGLRELDFMGDFEKARHTINRWVEEQTNDRIKDLIQPGVLKPDTRLVLTNAIYFKAAWQNNFSSEGTKPRPFTLASGRKVDVPMMAKQEKTAYYAGPDFQLVELPYQRHELSMVVLLPKKHDGLPALEKQLTPANLARWLKAAQMHDVDLQLPKFKITAEFQLNDVLAALGMTDAFDERKADFSGLTTRERLVISAVVHKAFVDVHEKGTEAAAATAVVIGVTALPPEYPKAVFHADRPFLFLIKERQTGSVLFLGRFVQP